MSVMSRLGFNKVTVTLFLSYLILGSMVFSHYGVSWDEPISRANGGVNVKFIGERIAPFLLTDSIRAFPDLNDWQDKDYGVAFETTVVALEQLFRLTDISDIFLFRHLATFLFFYCGVLALYAIVRQRYGDYRIGLLAATMFILSPRFFADSFYNSKDIVFAAAFLIAVYTLVRFLSKPNVFWAITHGFASALAIDVRIMGIVIPVATLAIFVVSLCKREAALSKHGAFYACYFLSTIVFTVMMFPWLWSDPIRNFVIALKNMSNFRWDQYILYMGSYVRATEIPWHYAPVWIAITTPIVYLGLFVVGAVTTVRNIVSNHLRLWSDDSERQDFIFLAIFFVPIISVVLLRSVLYDGWRQLYFLYPFLILIGVRGFVALLSLSVSSHLRRYVLIATVGMGLTLNAIWMIRAHPLQNVYFNLFAGKGWVTKFDVDYWGLANRDAFEYILENDNRTSISIRAVSLTSLEHSLLILPLEARNRFVIERGVTRIVDGRLDADITNLAPTDYIFTNYRIAPWSPDQAFPGYKRVREKRVAGELIYSLYRRDN